MSKTKRKFEEFIDWLSRRSGYTYCEVMDFWNEYIDDISETGECIDIPYFIGVTMERDW